MRALWTSLAAASIAALTLGCSDDPMTTGSSASPPAGRATYAGTDPLVISSDAMTVTVNVAPFGIVIANAAGDVVLQTLDDLPKVAGDDIDAYGPIGATHRTQVIQAPPALIEGFDHVTGVDDRWQHGLSIAAATATSSSVTLDLFDPEHDASTFHVELALDGGELDVRATSDDAKLDTFGQSFVMPEDEHIFGLGERNVSVDHRGRHYGCWVEEGGIPSGESAPPGPNNPAPNGPTMTHIPVPFFVSSKGYGLYVDTTWRTGFSFGAEDARYSRLESEGGRLDYKVFVASEPKQIIGAYVGVTGHAHLPAPWVFGPRRRTDHGVMVDGMTEIDALRAKHVPTTMADDTAHFLPIGTQVGQEDVLAAWTADLHAKGFRAIAYFNAFVSVTDARTTDLVKEARDGDYFIKTDDGEEFDTFVISAGPQTAAQVDLTNPDAVSWYQGLLDEALALGYDGWMLDFGEYVPPKAKMHDGRSGFEAHNAFPLFYDKAVAEHLREVRGDDFMYYARSGYAGSQAWAPFVWSGDPAASYDDAKGLPSQVRAGVNAGMSGFPYWGSDISGYSCEADPPTDKTLYIRWAQFGALSPDMHDDNACAQKPDDQPDKWTLWSDAETTQIYGDYARLHTRLLPYLYAAAEEAAETGTPIMRHPFLEHPTEPEAWKVEFEYYFGPALYVAPIVVRDATSRDLWLPPGTWFDWWTSAVVDGGRTITRDAPLAELPMWLRAGTVVPMLDASIETLAPGPTPGVVTPEDVQGVIDVRAGLAPTAADAASRPSGGRSFEVHGQDPALPSGFTNATDEADLETCDACARIDTLDDGVQRLRVTTTPAKTSTVAAGGVTLVHKAPAALRVRWDVLVAP